MHKGTIEITNKGLGVKLINSTSFGESMISAGFIQKTIKVDLHVRFNCAYPQRNGHQKDSTPKRSVRHHQVGPASPTCTPPGPLGLPISLSFKCRFSTAS